MKRTVTNPLTDGLTFPQRLKPFRLSVPYGTAEAVPLQPRDFVEVSSEVKL